MKSLHHPVVTVCLALILLAVGESACAQAPATPHPQPAPASTADVQKAMLSDAEHLVELARQLKASVDKTRRDELSLQVIREADAIEKLARSAKARIQ